MWKSYLHISLNAIATKADEIDKIKKKSIDSFLDKTLVHALFKTIV